MGKYSSALILLFFPVLGCQDFLTISSGISLIAIGPLVTLVGPGGVVKGYILTWQAAIGPFLEQVADWSKGSVHVMQGLSLAVTMGVACDQDLISTHMGRRS